jgi:hypothetical protein
MRPNRIRPIFFLDFPNSSRELIVFFMLKVLFRNH